MQGAVYQTCKSSCYLLMGNEAFKRNARFEQVLSSVHNAWVYTAFQWPVTSPKFQQIP